MAKIERFEDLEIWKKAEAIAVTIYKLTGMPGIKNDFGLKDQIQRAAFSISNNIAEGFEYNNTKDFIRFLRYSKASCGELRSQLSIIQKIGLIELSTYESIYTEIIILSKQISGFIKYLNKFEKEKIIN